VIRTYEAQWLPGSLQTEAYADAMIRLGTYSQRDDDVARRVQLRLQRQQVLTRSDPPKLWAIIDKRRFAVRSGDGKSCVISLRRWPRW
jgi:hypothetical protein